MAKSLAVKRGLVWAILIAIFVMAFMILKPILISVTLGLLMAYIFSPVYKAIQLRIRSKNLSAFLFILALLFLVIAPMIYFAPIVVEQTYDAFMKIQNFDLATFLSKYVDKKLTGIIASNVNSVVSNTVSSFLNQFTTLLINLPSFLLQVAVFLFTFFFAIRDSDEFRRYVSELSPFSKHTEEKFLSEFRGITNAIVFGQVLIGLVQGLALWAGLFFLGVPKSLVLGLIAGLVSVIPVLGSWLVWLPVGLLLLVAGNAFSGIFLLLYGGIFVSSIDNLLRPYLLSKQSQLPVALSIIGTIGGLYVFGLLGLIFGPLILAYALIVLDFYRKGRLDELFRR